MESPFSRPFFAKNRRYVTTLPLLDPDIYPKTPGFPLYSIYIPWQPLGPLPKVKLLVGPTGKIPRSTQKR